jgi:glycosyltransferase involved in cell wall biosynthesis
MKITVVLCTLNRCQVLAKTLESVAASELPESVEWEVLVVDNNSSDQTREVVEEFCSRHPGRFRYAFEPQLGKSFALNTGVREALGDVLAFMDDDVTVEPTWLQHLTAPLYGVEWAGAGGRILPSEAFSPPRWLGLEEPYNLGGPLAGLLDLGEKPCRLHQAPYGTNMAFRKEAFEKYGLFRTDLGPGAAHNTSRLNEDTEFGRRLMAAGERLRYEPCAIVYHPILENRLQKEYYLNWWFDYGRALVREWGRGASFLGVPRPYFNILRLVSTTMVLRMWRWVSAPEPQRRFFWKCWVWATAGQIREYYRLARTSGALLPTP